MGPKLRELVESQLSDDLKHYRINVNNINLKFDWSESCIEGHHLEFLDGSLENYSGVSVFDEQDNLIADGWMEFVNGGQYFLAYWDFITTWNGDQKLAKKNEPGIPDHIWQQIPEELKSTWTKERVKKARYANNS